MRINQKSDALDRFSFFENLSSAISKSPSSGVFFKNNEAFVFDDIACGKIVVRDGRYDSHIFYDFKTGDTLRLDTLIVPRFENKCRGIFFLNRRKMIRFLENLDIPKRKAQKANIFVEVHETCVHFTIRAAKGEVLGTFSQPIIIDKKKCNNIHPENLKFCTKFYYFHQILLYSFQEYDIIGVRYNTEKEIYLFGKNFKKPNICWLLRTV